MRSLRGLIAFAIVVAWLAAPAAAGDGLDERIRKLEELVRKQQEEIVRLRDGAERQKVETDSLSAEIDRFVAKAEDETFWQQPNTLRAFWKEGLKFESADGTFKASMFGRVFFDMATYDENFDEAPAKTAKDVIYEDTEFSNEVRTRTARLGFDTQLFENSYVKAEFDFAGSKTALKDVYMEQRAIPIAGNVRVGHFKEPFSLEEYGTSGRFISFMERGLPNAFVPARNVGLMLYDKAYDGRMTWAAGVFSTTDDQANGRTDPSLTARITGTPWYEEDGKQVLHLGLAGSWRRQADDKWRLKATPESRTSLSTVDTGDFTAEHAMLVGLESALVLDRFSLQGEYITMDMDSRDYGDPRFDGWYVYASWFLTGESRAYKEGTFGRTKVKANVNDPAKAGGTGAVEVLLRYSTIDLDDGDLVGGRESNWTAGLNYYLNPHMRIMLNYVMADIRNVGDLGVFQVRFQFDF